MVGCSRLKKGECENTDTCTWVVGSGCKAVSTSGKKGKATKTDKKKVETKPKPQAKAAKAITKKEAPSKDDPLRKFYTSLLKERPSSEMAQKWCGERGLI